jgi:hypothetical protein
LRVEQRKIQQDEVESPSFEQGESIGEAFGGLYLDVTAGFGHRFVEDLHVIRVVLYEKYAE